MTQMDQTDLNAGKKKTVSPVLAAIIGFILGVLLTLLLNNWQDVKEGWQDGWQGKPPRYETKPAGK